MFQNGFRPGFLFGFAGNHLLSRPLKTVVESSSELSGVPFKRVAVEKASKFYLNSPKKTFLEKRTLAVWLFCQSCVASLVQQQIPVIFSSFFVTRREKSHLALVATRLVRQRKDAALADSGWWPPAALPSGGRYTMCDKDIPFRHLAPSATFDKILCSLPPLFFLRRWTVVK